MLGSVKTNIGHSEAASGIASIIKVVLAMQNGVIPRQLHFNRPNRYIDLAESGLSIATEHLPWPVRNGVRRAGVSAFGFGGTNAHVILQSGRTYPSATTAHAGPEVLLLSARTPQQLRELGRRMLNHLRAEANPLEEVCFTLATGRQHFPCRWALVGTSQEEMLVQLERHLVAAEDTPPTKTARLGLWLGANFAFSSLSPGLAPGYHAALQAADLACAKYPDLSSKASLTFSRAWGLGQMMSALGIKFALVTGEGAGGLAASALAGLTSLESAALALAEQDRADLKVESADAVDAANKSKCAVLLVAGTAPTGWTGRVLPLPDTGPELLAHLYRFGVNITWPTVYAGRALRPTSLPTYPFARERHWVTPVNHADESLLRRATLSESLADIRA